MRKCEEKKMSRGGTKIVGGGGKDPMISGQGSSTTSSSFAFLLPDTISKSPSPSARDGVTAETERMQRIFGCDLIQEATILLGLKQVVAATAQNLFHRFYFRRSLKRFDVFFVAMGSLTLAAKLEESQRMLRDMLYVFHRMFLCRRDIRVYPLHPSSATYVQWKAELQNVEMYVLKELGFSFYQIMEHPHKFILYYVKLLNGSSGLAQVAWNYMNDSMRLPLMLTHPAQVIAGAALLCAAIQLQFPLPDRWWLLVFADYDRICLVSEEILSLYASTRFGWIDPLSDSTLLQRPVESTIKNDYIIDDTCGVGISSSSSDDCNSNTNNINSSSSNNSSSSHNNNHSSSNNSNSSSNIRSSSSSSNNSSSSSSSNCMNSNSGGDLENTATLNKSPISNDKIDTYSSFKAQIRSRSRSRSRSAVKSDRRGYPAYNSRSRSRSGDRRRREQSGRSREHSGRSRSPNYGDNRAKDDRMRGRDERDRPRGRSRSRDNRDDKDRYRSRHTHRRSNSRDRR